MFSDSTLQHYLGIINQNRQSYSSGFRPGAQTLESRKFDEEKRQYEQNFAEDKFRDRRNFGENVRQFNAKLAAEAVAGGSAFKPTQSQLKDMATADAYGRAIDKFERNYWLDRTIDPETGKVAIDPKTGAPVRFLKEGDPNYRASRYPLYYTVNMLLKNPQEVSDMTATGADQKAIIDSLIVSKYGKSPKDYFKEDKMGQGLKDAYEAKFGSLDKQGFDPALIEMYFRNGGFGPGAQE